MLRKFILTCLITTSIQLAANEPTDNGLRLPKMPAPHVSEEAFKDIFGEQLAKANGLKQQLLLAVAFDHTTEASPFQDQNIGIPYIVEFTPQYWVKLLALGDRSIDTLVNNALFLMFSKDRAPDADLAAIKLLNAAASQGYWPADFYLAEYQLKKHLVKQSESFQVVSSMLGNPETYAIAQDTMKKLNSCAEIGFAPCQFRIGLWMSHSPKTLKDGIEILRNAIQIALMDKRYNGIIDDSVALASGVIANHGFKVGLSETELSEYQALFEHFL